MTLVGVVVFASAWTNIGSASSHTTAKGLRTDHFVEGGGSVAVPTFLEVTLALVWDVRAVSG